MKNKTHSRLRSSASYKFKYLYIYLSLHLIIRKQLLEIYLHRWPETGDKVVCKIICGISIKLKFQK